MQDVELRLIANNKDAIKGVRELAQESQKLYDNNKKAQQREVGLIADLEKGLAKLKEAQRNAFDARHIEYYNKRIKDAERELKEYNELGVKSEKQAASMTQTITKWALSLGGATVALKLVKDALLTTTAGINAFNIAGVAAKQVMYNLVTGASSLTDGLQQVIIAQKKLNDLRLQEKIDNFEAAKYMVLYKKYSVEANDHTKTSTERVAKYDKAIQALNQSMNIEIETTQKRIDTLAAMIDAAPGNEKLKIEWADLNTKLLTLEYERQTKLKEMEGIRSSLLQSEIDKRKAMFERYYAEIDKANEEADRKQEKRDDEARKALEQQYNYYRDQLFDFFDDADKQREKDWTSEMKWAKAKMTAEQKIAKEAWDAMIEAEKKTQEAEQNTKEQREKNLMSYIDSVKGYIDTLSWISEKQLQELEKTRDILDTRISETQSALETEAELQKEGFANNVNAKRVELEALKKQRDQALIEEEKARKKQRQIELAALLAEKTAAIAQIIINTKVANSKNLILGPFGIPMTVYNNVAAAAGIAAIIAAVAAATSAKFAKGGWTGEGRLRDSTGERVAGVVHEKEFVVRKGPASRFRPMLEAINRDDNKMILQSFNKIMPEVGGSVNNVIVENDGPNRRLDEVNYQLRKLNNKEEIISLGNKTIIKKGNSTRVIRK